MSLLKLIFQLLPFFLRFLPDQMYRGFSHGCFGCFVFLVTGLIWLKLKLELQQHVRTWMEITGVSLFGPIKVYWHPLLSFSPPTLNPCFHFPTLQDSSLFFCFFSLSTLSFFACCLRAWAPPVIKPSGGLSVCLSVCLYFTERKTTVGDALLQAPIVRFRHAGVTAVTAGEGEVLFPTCGDITSLTCAEVHYHLVTQKSK